MAFDCEGFDDGDDLADVRWIDDVDNSDDPDDPDRDVDDSAFDDFIGGGPIVF